ncbi:der1-like protein derlin [Anaeramoeba ignava]|uniref:Der1-like protein derlin n=1 Tax=Anaeramoeba ignava TaxID=1746090 RepID=A0A9Q0L4R7_ANAIG|nr:der1-like protein derlin [Anaeramoeba ignava]
MQTPKTVTFRNAQATKVLIVLLTMTTLFSLLLPEFQANSKFTEKSFNDVFSFFPRLLLNQFVFGSVLENFFGALFLYYCRDIERMLGTRKFVAFLYSILLANFALQIIFLSFKLFINFTETFIVGPYGILFGLFIQFVFQVPGNTILATISGFQITDKWIPYILSMELFSFSLRYNKFSAICGILSGILYFFNFFSLQKTKIPNSLIDFAKKYIEPVLNKFETPKENTREEPTVNRSSAAYFTPDASFFEQMNFDPKYTFGQDQAWDHHYIQEENSNNTIQWTERTSPSVNNEKKEKRD